MFESCETNGAANGRFAHSGPELFPKFAFTDNAAVVASGAAAVQVIPQVIAASGFAILDFG